MDPRPLGRTGIRVAPVALGTVKLGRNADVRYPAAFELPTDAAVEGLLGRALELGVNLFDTAPAYGSSEERLGRFVAAHRERVVICTKCGEEWEAGESRHDFSATAIRASLERSLRRLRTEHVDVLLLHSAGDDVGIVERGEAVATMVELKARGLVRAIGISAKSEAGVDAAVRVGLDVVMAPYGLHDPSRGAALARAAQAGLGVLGIKCLASGHTGTGPSPAERIAHVVTRPFVTAAVVGTLDGRHLEEAVRAARAALTNGPGAG